MIKYILLFVIVANSCCGAEYAICCGHKFTIDLDLNNPDTSKYFVSATNAAIFSNGEISYWKSIDFTKESEVIYKLTPPTNTLFVLSTWFSNSSLEYDTKQEFIVIYASKDPVSYRQINSTGFPDINRQLTRDTSFASAYNNQIFLKGTFKGELVKFLKSGAHFDFGVIPEPSSFIPFAIAILLFPLRSKRRI